MLSSKKRILTALLAVTLLIITLVVSALSFWAFKLDKTIQERLAGRRFIPPLEFYSSPLQVSKGQRLPKSQMAESLRRLRYSERKTDARIRPGEFAFLDPNTCQGNLSEELEAGTQTCVLIWKRPVQDTGTPERDFVLIGFGADDQVLSVFGGEPLAALTNVELEPILFAQFFGADPILRDVVPLGDAPSQCLSAVIAIEDSDFLEHQGVSASGILRASLKNLRAGRVSQGGSTITQQLVKNYFLTPEKTLRRKLTEMAMALLLESHATKDDILETYINEIYMGQNGSFQIRGYGAAAHHYFGKSLSELGLSECALLAALVNSPGLYNPFTKPENAIKRRALVLSRMVDLEILTEAEKKSAENQNLPKSPQRPLSEPAPFFVEHVRRELSELGIDIQQGLRVYTTMDLTAQEAGQAVVRSGLERLEAENKRVKKIKTETSKILEGALLSADPKTGEIKAIVGGRNFRQSQFNRATQSRRQVGSIFKPIVYLTALQRGLGGETPTPLTLLDDEKFTVKYEGQTWSPVNYEKKLNGPVPMYFALTKSLNVATASLAIETGLDAIIEVAHDLGIQSELKAFPSLALGAFEMAPIEVLQVYTTLAQMGVRTPLSTIRKVESLDGALLYERRLEPMTVANAEDSAVLVGMMKQTLQRGTAWFVSKLGFDKPAAGKTGTTSDTKDAWFAGFTPHHVAVVWVGYDDNTENGLTGASGAVPIWAEYMKRATLKDQPDDFIWPEGTVTANISVETQRALNVGEDKEKKIEDFQLIFREGTQPETSEPTTSEVGQEAHQ